jgi:hypothetical protein
MASGASTRHLPDSQRRRARTEKSCGPDARRLASSLAVMRRPTGARIDHLRGDGGNSATLPEESAKDTVKTIAQGRPGDPARPVIHPVCVFWRTDLRVPAGARPSLRPCHDEGRDKKQSSGESRREIANSRPLFETCNGAKRAGCRGAVSARASAKSASRAWHLYLLGQ